MLISDQTVVSIAVPSIGADLDIAGAGLSWVVNAYVLTFGGLLLLAGRATDLFGQRRMFIAGMVLFAIASLAGGLAPSAAMLIDAWAVHGCSGSTSRSASAARCWPFACSPRPAEAPLGGSTSRARSP
jgi:MFS family permease